MLCISLYWAVQSNGLGIPSNKRRGQLTVVQLRMTAPAWRVFRAGVARALAVRTRSEREVESKDFMVSR